MSALSTVTFGESGAGEAQVPARSGLGLIRLRPCPKSDIYPGDTEKGNLGMGTHGIRVDTRDALNSQ